jgi:hypothetical protein
MFRIALEIFATIPLGFPTKPDQIRAAASKIADRHFVPRRSINK